MKANRLASIVLLMYKKISDKEDENKPNEKGVCREKFCIPPLLPSYPDITQALAVPLLILSQAVNDI